MLQYLLKLKLINIFLSLLLLSCSNQNSSYQEGLNKADSILALKHDAIDTFYYKNGSIHGIEMRDSLIKAIVTRDSLISIEDLFGYPSTYYKNNYVVEYYPSGTLKGIKIEYVATEFLIDTVYYEDALQIITNTDTVNSKFFDSTGKQISLFQLRLNDNN